MAMMFTQAVISGSVDSTQRPANRMNSARLRAVKLELRRRGDGDRTELVAQFHRASAGCAHGRPLREALAVGVAGAGEVRPIGGDCVGELAVGVGEGTVGVAEA